MPNFYCSHCNQPIHARDEDGGQDVSCPACFRVVRVPGLHGRRGDAAPTWPWVCLASLAAVTVTIVAAMMFQPPSVEGSPAGPTFIARILSPLIIAGIPTLMLAILFGSIAMLLNRSFSRVAGLIYSILLLPLILFTYFGDRLLGGEQVGKINELVQNKTSTVEVAFADAYENLNKAIKNGSANKAAEQAALTGIKEDTQKMLASMLDESGMPKQTDLQFPVTSPTNDAERLRQFMQSFFSDMANLQNDYLKELETAGIGTLLAADRVDKDTDFSESSAMLVKIRKIVQEYKAKSDTLVNGMPERIRNSEFPSRTKAELQKGYDRGLARSKPLFKENWNIEESLIEVMAKLLEHLHTTRDQWILQNEQLVFQDQGSADRYNELMQEIDRGVQRQTEIRQQSAKETLEKINKL